MDVSVEELLVGIERDLANRQVWSQLIANKFADDIELHTIPVDHVLRSTQTIINSLASIN